jgi:hypothetical protein
MGDKIGSYRVLVGRPAGKRQRGRPVRRWEINIKCIFRMWVGWAWIGFILLRIETDEGRR